MRSGFPQTVILDITILMTISSREKEVPRRLPTARLYLDDIEAIQKIILEAASRLPTRPEIDPTYYSIQTTFSVGDQICTEIQDLPKVGKETRDFEMNLDGKDMFAARFSVSDDGTHWWSLGLATADMWQVFHAMETIIERRKLWRDRLVPGSVRKLFALITSFALTVSSVFIAIILSKKISPAHSEVILLPVCFLLGIGVVPLIWRFVYYRDAVILRFSWEQAERREDRNTKIAIAGVSAFIAFLLGVASMALKHKFWP